MGRYSNTTIHRTLITCTAAVALGLIGTSATRAADLAWTGGNGDATDANNWSTQTWDGTQWIIDNASHLLPGASDDVYINDATGTPDFRSSGTYLNTVTIGNNSNASMHVSNGALVYTSGNMVFGGDDLTGTLSIDGQNSSVQVGGMLAMANGTINITNGGSIYTHDMQSVMTNHGTEYLALNVDGAGSLFHADTQSTSSRLYGGSIAVTNGGYLKLAGSGYPFSNMQITIDGMGSIWDGIIPYDTNDLKVSHGAVVTAGSQSFHGYGQTARLFFTDQAKAYLDSLQVGDPEHQGTTLFANGRGTLIKATNGISLNRLTGNWQNHVQPSSSSISISSGARIETNSISSNGNTRLAIALDQDSKLVVNYGNGTIYFPGDIRFNVGTRVAVGQYEPIEYETLTQTGSIGIFQYTGTIAALGGKFDPNTHKVTVAYAKAANAGDTISIDLANTQRIRFTDTATGKRLGLAFAGSDTSKILTVSASLITDPASSGLTSLLASGDGSSYIDAWSIHPTAGYTQGEEAYLSIEVGSGFDITTFKAWHYDGTIWESYTPYDISYDGLYVGFTVTGFSSYALSAGSAMSSYAAVPEPASLGLIGIAAAGLLRRKRNA